MTTDSHGRDALNTGLDAGVDMKPHRDAAGRIRRSLALVAVMALVATGLATGTLRAGPANAVTVDHPAEVVEGSVATFSGTCDDPAATHALLDVSWDTPPTNTSSFEVGADGSWTGGRYVTGTGPATVAVQCAIEVSPGFERLGDPVVIDVERVEPSIEVVVTVGTVPSSCATTTDISVPAGTTVYWCITMTNHAGTEEPYHEIADTDSGVWITDALYPVDSLDSINNLDLGVVGSTSVTAALTNTVTWTAYGLDGSRYRELVASGSATVSILPDDSTTVPEETDPTITPSTVVPDPTTAPTAPTTAPDPTTPTTVKPDPSVPVTTVSATTEPVTTEPTTTRLVVTPKPTSSATPAPATTVPTAGSAAKPAKPVASDPSYTG